MKRDVTKTLATLAALAAFIPTTAPAYIVEATVSGTISIHSGAVDIRASSCNYWGAETGVVGSLFWNVTIRTTGIVCYGNGSGNQNEAKHIFADGWAFRQWHFIKTASSYDRTCDRCQVGDVGGTGNVTGPTVHFQYDKYGTPNSTWYTVINGQQVNMGDTIGYL